MMAWCASCKSHTPSWLSACGARLGTVGLGWVLEKSKGYFRTLALILEIAPGRGVVGIQGAHAHCVGHVRWVGGWGGGLGGHWCKLGVAVASVAL